MLLICKLKRLEKRPSTLGVGRQSAFGAPLYAICCCALNSFGMQALEPKQEAAALVAVDLEVTALQQAPAAKEQTALQNEGGPPPVGSTSIIKQPTGKQLVVSCPSAVEQVSGRTACLDVW